MVSKSTGLPRHQVCPIILRHIWNCARYLERPNVRRVPHGRYDDDKQRGELEGSTSRMVEFQDTDGEVLARAFFYRDSATGAVAGSGKYDPKWVRSGDEALIPIREPAHECPACRLGPFTADQ